MSENPPSDKHARVLAIIEAYIDQHGRPPSLRDIARKAGFKSPRSAQQYVSALVDKGFLAHDKNTARGIRLLRPSRRGIPLLGHVPAGQPFLAEEHIEDWIDPFEGLDLGHSPSPTFAVRVVGESMRDAGILNGDTVIVRREDTVRNSQIAVVYLNGEATVKRVLLDKGCVTLQPANPDFEPIVVSEGDGIELHIAGPVVGVFRRYA